MTSQIMPSPPIYPATPQVPAPNTATGILNDLGLPVVSQVDPLGDFFDPDMSDMRFEYISEFVFSSNGNNSDVLFQHIGNSLLYDLNSAYTPMRMLKFLGSWYADVEWTYLFYAIKPAMTTGKLLIQYTPDNNYSNDLTYNTYSTTKIWDLAESDTCTFDVKPWSPINHKPTRTKNGTALNFMPYAMSYPQKVSVSILTPYVPGSIFPTDIDIIVLSQVRIVPYLPVLPSFILNENLNITTDFSQRLYGPLQDKKRKLKKKKQ